MTRLVRYLTVAAFLAVGAFSLENAFAKPMTPRPELEADAQKTLVEFHKRIEGSEEFIKAAKAVLVVPTILKGGLVVGASEGKAALQINGETAEYYTAGGWSLGLTAGVQSSSLVLCFMTDEALAEFRASSGWTWGIDGKVALIAVGASGSINTETTKDSIVGFSFNNQGVMADLSFKGSKFRKMG